MEGVRKYRSSRISFISNYVLVLLLVAFLSFLRYYLHVEGFTFTLVAYAVLLIIVLLLLEPEFIKIYRYYLVEEDQLSMVEGVFVRKKLSIPYDKITDVAVSKTILGRTLNFGDVKASGIRNDIFLKGMRNPHKIYREIDERIPTHRGKAKEGKK